MHNPVSLSYILTTFNKLEYLKVSLPYLIDARQADEEIVIVDGGSEDGTKEYLQDLFNDGKIQQYLSEKDAGEAHGTNKAMAMATGKLIKIITDDDGYDYPSIQACKAFMLNNLQVDVLGTEGYNLDMALPKKAATLNSGFILYQNWVNEKTHFSFTGLGLMFRKSSLPLLGLFDPRFSVIDLEYTLRVTSGKANVGWFTGCTFINIVNRRSNSRRFAKNLYREIEFLEKVYNPKSYFLSKRYFKNKYVNLRSRTSLAVRRVFPQHPRAPQDDLTFSETFKRAIEVLRAHNQDKIGSFYPESR